MKLAIAEALPVMDERRRETRFKSRPLDLRLETAVFIDTVRLINIGRLGFSINTMIGYPPGTALILHIPGWGPLKGRTVWQARNQMGGRFDQPLSEEMLISLSEAE